MAIKTNNHGLPEMYIKALKMDTHLSFGDISVTQLIDAPQVRMLKKKHGTDEDAMDRIWMMLGTAFHKYIEDANMPNRESIKIQGAIDVLAQLSNDSTGEENKGFLSAIKWLKKVNERFTSSEAQTVWFEHSMTVEVEGYVISGTADILKIVAGFLEIEDHKVTSTFSVMYPDAKEKWAKQLNIYAWMAWMLGFPEPKKISVHGVFRDWTAGKAIGGGNYPRKPYRLVPLKLESMDSIERYVKARLALHRAAENGQQIDCTAEERWANATMYAVKQGKSSRAAAGGVLDSEAKAKEFIKDNAHRLKDPWIETRPGSNRRCEGYCPVAEHCPQYKKIIESNQKINL